ncbi:unnamed protein product [Rangifer tarandus platyrhynchus]|uniref:Uncharacterized protein n=1 Tax=Rangifer tarandus platyrhynchus TaxID=3082113 RepID=A0AC59ZG10_RANTA
MESLLPASGSTFRLILEHLQGVLLVVSESLTNVPGPPAFLWEILVCAVMIVVIVKRRYTSKSAKLLGQKSSAHDEVCGPCGEDENAGPMAQAEEALRSPGLEASPPRLQTLGQSAMSAMRSKSSFRDNDDLLKMGRESQPPRFSQVTDGKPISKASRKSGAQPQTKMDDSKKTTHFPEGSVLLAQEIARWQMRVQKMKEEERLEQSKKGVIGDADFSGSLWSPKEIAQPLWEERQSNEELSGQISSLEAEEASLLGENSQLEREIRRLRLKLQVLPQTFEDHIAQLQKRCLEEELSCLNMEKKLGSVCKAVKSLSEDRDLYKRMAEDLGKELMRTNCYHQKQICAHEKRARALGMAAVSTQSRLKELRRESDRMRQTLAKLHCRFQPFPRGPHAPAAPPAAHRGPKGSGHPPGPQAPQGAGWSCGEGSGI